MIHSMFYLIALVSMLYVIAKVWINEPKMSILGKLKWTIFAVFFSVITAIVYLATRKNDEI